MTTHLAAAFEITAWEQDDYDDQGTTKLARTHVEKRFHGDLEGTSTAELLMASAPAGSAAYVGIERITGTLHGRAGSFVFTHHAAMGSDGQFLHLTILPNSGTGELQGITGGGTVEIAPDGGHTLILDYDLA